MALPIANLSFRTERAPGSSILQISLLGRLLLSRSHSQIDAKSFLLRPELLHHAIPNLWNYAIQFVFKVLFHYSVHVCPEICVPADLRHLRLSGLALRCHVYCPIELS
jgi:hypothetical protein